MVVEVEVVEEVEEVEDSLFALLESASETSWIGLVWEVSRGSTNARLDSVKDNFGIFEKLMRRIVRRCIMMCCWRLTGCRLKVYLTRTGLDDRSWQVVIFE